MGNLPERSRGLSTFRLLEHHMSLSPCLSPSFVSPSLPVSRLSPCLSPCLSSLPVSRLSPSNVSPRLSSLPISHLSPCLSSLPGPQCGSLQGDGGRAPCRLRPRAPAAAALPRGAGAVQEGHVGPVSGVRGGAWAGSDVRGEARFGGGA